MIDTNTVRTVRTSKFIQKTRGLLDDMMGLESEEIEVEEGVFKTNEKKRRWRALKARRLRPIKQVRWASTITVKEYWTKDKPSQVKQCTYPDWEDMKNPQQGDTRRWAGKRKEMGRCVPKP